MDGFWWGFVTMTTVGYGDKVPKTFVARLFSVMWILMGITMTSLYVAELSAHTMLAEQHDGKVK